MHCRNQQCIQHSLALQIRCASKGFQKQFLSTDYQGLEFFTHQTNIFLGVPVRNVTIPVLVIFSCLKMSLYPRNLCQWVYSFCLSVRILVSSCDGIASLGNMQNSNSRLCESSKCWVYSAVNHPWWMSMLFH